MSKLIHLAITFPKIYREFIRKLKNLPEESKYITLASFWLKIEDFINYIINTEIEVFTIDYTPYKLTKDLDLEIELIINFLIKRCFKLINKLSNLHFRIYVLNNDLPYKTYEIGYLGKRINIVVNYDYELELKYLTLKAITNKRKFENFNDVVKYLLLGDCNYPFPDLLIIYDNFRIPNFIPLNIAYTELVFIDKSFYEISTNDIEYAIKQYYSRSRRFGK